jgi:hypothetical protein
MKIRGSHGGDHEDYRFSLWWQWRLEVLTAVTMKIKVLMVMTMKSRGSRGDDNKISCSHGGGYED